VRRKRYFILTENALNYYKSEDTKQAVAGSIHLNWLGKALICTAHLFIMISLFFSLCSVVAQDKKEKPQSPTSPTVDDSEQGMHPVIIYINNCHS